MPDDQQPPQTTVQIPRSGAAGVIEATGGVLRQVKGMSVQEVLMLLMMLMVTFVCFMLWQSTEGERRNQRELQGILMRDKADSEEASRKHCANESKELRTFFAEQNERRNKVDVEREERRTKIDADRIKADAEREEKTRAVLERVAKKLPGPD